MARARRSTVTRSLVATAAVVAAAGCTSGSAPSPSSPADAAAPATARTVRHVRAGGEDRTYRLYVPATIAGGDPVPVLVALHGGGGSGEHFEDVSGFDALAARAGFIVAYPDAVRPPAGQVATWDAGDCCGYAARTGVDDVGFVRAVIDDVSADHRVDPRRVYLEGFSNGGMLAYRLACEAGGTVAAVGVQSATLEDVPCRPPAPVSLLHIHGTADTEVPLAGGRGDGLSRAAYTPPEEAAATVAAADGCGPTPAVAADPARPDAQLHTWPGCPSGIDVELVTVPGATHAGAMRDSAAETWAFLSAHPRPVA